MASGAVDLTGESDEEADEQLEALSEELRTVEQELHAVEAQMRQLDVRRSALRARRDELHRCSRQQEQLTARLALAKQNWRADFPHTEKLKAALRDTFKLDGFRENQLEVINATLTGKDVLVILPAGGGKSLCYQLPAVIEEGFTLVISPLLSLIDDQVMALRRLGVRCGDLTTLTSQEDSNALMKELDDPKSTLRLVYCTPEKVVKSKRFFAKLEKAYKAGRLKRIAVDEAHCISQWGNDFRTDYTKLHVLKQQFPKTPLLVLTATATAQDILEKLDVPLSLRFRSSVHRANLFFEIRPKPTGAGGGGQLEDALVALVREFKADESGIVYCFSRKECETFADALVKNGVLAAPYHAHMEDSARIAAHRAWSDGRVQVICATCAFGMGVNKVDVRFVVHLCIPKSIENYYQEAGRAGRDGKTARCICFWRPTDMARQSGMVFFEHSGRAKLLPMVGYALSRSQCRHGLISEHFDEVAQSTPDMCDVCQQPAAARAASAARDVSDCARGLLDALASIHGAGKQATMLQLVDAWKKSPNGKSPAGKALGVEEAMELICHMAIRGALAEEYQNTAYATNVYLKPGPRAEALRQGKLSLALHTPFPPAAAHGSQAAARGNAGGENASRPGAGAGKKRPAAAARAGGKKRAAVEESEEEEDLEDAEEDEEEGEGARCRIITEEDEDDDFAPDPAAAAKQKQKQKKPAKRRKVQDEEEEEEEEAERAGAT